MADGEMTDILAPFAPFIAAASQKYGVRTSLIRAHIMKESGGDSNAIGDGGRALGLLQIHKDAATEMGFVWAELKDPEKNIDCGVGYLAKQIKRFGTIPIALMAFNQGPTVIGHAKAYSDAVLTLEQP
jgi:soluble lytic murein transglycosylase-like protein